jgi:hypothetical protein
VRGRRSRPPRLLGELVRTNRMLRQHGQRLALEADHLIAEVNHENSIPMDKLDALLCSAWTDLGLRDDQVDIRTRTDRCPTLAAEWARSRSNAELAFAQRDEDSHRIRRAAVVAEIARRAATGGPS